MYVTHGQRGARTHDGTHVFFLYIFAWLRLCVEREAMKLFFLREQGPILLVAEVGSWMGASSLHEKVLCVDGGARLRS